MKTTLTTEQSATLIAKGISVDKASMFAWQKVYDYKGNPLSKKDKNSEYNHGITLKKEMMICGLEHIEYKPIFTLADICALLPKEIVTDTIMCENDTCPISIRWDENCKKWFVGYDLVPRSVGVGVDSELIDALFSTLCWVIDNGHLLTK